MLTTNPELEAYLVPSRPWIDALATWLVPNKLSSTKFCQLIRSDRKERVSLYFVQISFFVGTSSKSIFDIQIEVLSRLNLPTYIICHATLTLAWQSTEKRLGLSLSLLYRGNWRESLREFAILTSEPYVRNIPDCFDVHFHDNKVLKAAMDAFLRGQSSATGSLKQKHQASEETTGTSSKRTIVPWVEK